MEVKQTEIDEVLKDKEKVGLSEESHSPLSSFTMFIRKNGDLQFYVDY
jgi:hypothetical protein